ncbi:MAG: flagellar biosynthesis repressor FlbT [Alphaproteobacteria bacterium]|nr:flagellar biosynthesis repressor FlbT [Alphaproteobacteria bacterium]
MPLKLKLAAHESFIVNGAVLVNGEFRTSLVIRNFVHVMREKSVLREADANTPTRRLYFTIQSMLMQPPPSAALMRTYKELLAQLREAYMRPENLETLDRADNHVESGDYYKALALLQPLISYEAQLLDVNPHEWRRSGHARPSGGG